MASQADGSSEVQPSWCDFFWLLTVWFLFSILKVSRPVGFWRLLKLKKSYKAGIWLAVYESFRKNVESKMSDSVSNWFSVVLVWAAGEKGRSPPTGLSWMVHSQDFAHKIFREMIGSDNLNQKRPLECPPRYKCFKNGWKIPETSCSGIRVDEHGKSSLSELSFHSISVLWNSKPRERLSPPPCSVNSRSHTLGSGWFLNSSSSRRYRWWIGSH